MNLKAVDRVDFLITHTEVLKQCITSWKGVIMASEDFCGHAGQLNTGDLQWMTMGWGIVQRCLARRSQSMAYSCGLI